MFLRLPDDYKRREYVDRRTRSSSKGQFRVVDRVHDCHATLDLGLEYERLPRYDKPGSSSPAVCDDTGRKPSLAAKQDYTSSRGNLCCNMADGIHRFSLRGAVWQVQLYIRIITASL